MMGIKGKI
jgi:hypothetical protein